MLAVTAIVLAGLCAMRQNSFNKSEVVFMYVTTPEIYQAYGATVVAWGASPSSGDFVSRAHQLGITYFGSVGMVTEFARYYERFPETYEQTLCRDVYGQPIKVPWLTDHQHKGIPYWWCCTNQPQFRQYLLERVEETVRGGADGVHVDDHLGTAGCVYQGGCFCDRCLAGFREYLQRLPAERRQRLGVENLDRFDYRQYVLDWLAGQGERETKLWERPLWTEWTYYHLRAAAAFMAELKERAEQVAGRPVPFGANAGLTSPDHLADYKTLALFSAEVNHEAWRRRFSAVPLMAYRLAEALGRPMAATGSGWDWAAVKEHDMDGLVRGWIALAYAAGQYFMVPHRMWCYTPERGTHWYDGPPAAYAPLYRFVRAHADLFDGYETLVEVGLLYSVEGVRRNREPIVRACEELARANVSFRMIVGGSEVVDHPLAPEEVDAVPLVIAVQPAVLDPLDQALLDTHRARGKVFDTVEEALAHIEPAVRVGGAENVWAMPRVKRGAPAVVHLLNRNYDAEADDVRPLHNVRVTVRPEALGLARVQRCILYSPGAEPQELKVEGNTITVPELGLWAVLRIAD